MDLIHADRTVITSPNNYCLADVLELSCKGEKMEVRSHLCLNPNTTGLKDIMRQESVTYMIINVKEVAVASVLAAVEML